MNLDYPGKLGHRFVIPSARGLKRFYLAAFGIHDVRTQLTAGYALRELADLSFSRMLGHVDV
jgi:hypothetical protein